MTLDSIKTQVPVPFASLEEPETRDFKHITGPAWALALLVPIDDTRSPDGLSFSHDSGRICTDTEGIFSNCRAELREGALPRVR